MRNKIKVEGVKLKEFVPSPVDTRWAKLGDAMASFIHGGESVMRRILRGMEQNRIHKLVSEVVDETTR